MLMNKKLANGIGLLMEKEGLNTVELANTLGIPKATLHKIITGKSAKPRPKTLIMIAEYFNIPIAQLIHGEIDEYIQRDKIRNIPIIDWDNIYDWFNEKLTKEDFRQTTPTNLDFSERSFALIFNEINSTLFKQGSVL